MNEDWRTREFVPPRLADRMEADMGRLQREREELWPASEDAPRIRIMRIPADDTRIRALAEVVGGGVLSLRAGRLSNGSGVVVVRSLPIDDSRRVRDAIADQFGEGIAGFSARVRGGDGSGGPAIVDVEIVPALEGTE